MKDGKFEVGDIVECKDDPLYRDSVPRWSEIQGPQRVIGVRSNGGIELLSRPNYWYMPDAWNLLSTAG